jgi:hypothetical protein
MMNDNNGTETYGYPAREVVGVFANPGALEGAVDQLEISGFARTTLSVLASDEAVKERVGHLYRTVGEIEDDSRAPQTGFVSSDSLVEAKAAAVGIPCYIGAVGAIAFVITGGALAASIAAAIAGGAVGAGLGALLARMIGHHHTDHVLSQLDQGGLVLWVSVHDGATERSALEILKNAGASDVHVHEIQREWTLKDRSVSEVQPDIFLERDN